MNIIERKTVRTDITRRIEIDRDTFLELLASQGECVPDNAAIYMMVPGGGDWSHTQLDLSDTPLVITWTEVVEDHE